MGDFPSPNPDSSIDEDEVEILEVEDLANAHDTQDCRVTFLSKDEDEEENEEQDEEGEEEEEEEEEEQEIDAVKCGHARRLDFKLGSEIMRVGVGRRWRDSSAEQKAATTSANRFGSD
jgi:hypothetical protein